MNIWRSITSLIIGLSFTSCATMTRWFDEPEKQKQLYSVKINSATKGLPIYSTEDGRERLLGYTPCWIYSDKAKIKYITVKNGEIYQTLSLQRKDRASIYWNFFPSYTFIWGYFVDKGTSRSRVYSKKEYYVNL